MWKIERIKMSWRELRFRQRPKGNCLMGSCRVLDFAKPSALRECGKPVRTISHPAISQLHKLQFLISRTAPCASCAIRKKCNFLQVLLANCAIRESRNARLPNSQIAQFAIRAICDRDRGCARRRDCETWTWPALQNQS